MQDLIGDIIAGHLKDCFAEIECIKRDNNEHKKQIDMLKKTSIMLTQKSVPVKYTTIERIS